MMTSYWRGAIAATVIASALMGTACGDGTETDSDYEPILTGDTGVPFGDGSVVGIDAGTLSDASTVTFDGAQSAPDANTQVDAQVNGDASTSYNDASAVDSGAQTDAGGGAGECCEGGNCLCHGPKPTSLTSARGPFKTENYTVAGAGCIFYPTDAKPPFAAVAISDGYIGSGGCNSIQTGQWGPLYASWGIVAMIVNTGSLDQPNQRGAALTKGIQAFKSENTKSGSPLFGKLAGRYGTSGFSMGGGGTSYASRDDKTLLSSVSIMPWGPVTSGVTVPTLVICGSRDSTASCAAHGNNLYRGIANTVPKMRVQVNDGHNGQPSAGGGDSGEVGLAFQKVFLEGDERWRPLLVAAPSEETNIK